MQEKKPHDNGIDMKELEKQLSCPTGKTGIEVANMMNETNHGMILNTIDFLDLQDEYSVLELGHGNGSHLSTLITRAKDIKYHGLEVSDTMFQEACRINQDTANIPGISFQLYDGINIPFNDAMFDRVMTVNTIYFWSNPVRLLSEIHRTLKSDARCVITFAQKEMMKKLPFVGNAFKLYDNNDIHVLAKESSLELVEIAEKTEQVKTKSGEMVERTYSMAKLRKH